MSRIDPYRWGTVAGLIERANRDRSRRLTRHLAGVLVATGPVAWRGARYSATETETGPAVVVDAFPGADQGIPIADQVELPGPL